MTDPMATTFLSQLNWRNAARSFDPSIAVADSDLQKILEAIRLAPTSFGLQPFDVYVVKDAATKEAIFNVGYKQPQFATAPVILAFASRRDVSVRIEEYMALVSHGDVVQREKLSGLEKAIKNSVGRYSPAQAAVWADRQAYIALGFALAACAELRVDSCPMEGFQATEVNRILKLSPDQHTCVMLPIGHRDPSATVRPKTRFAADHLFRWI